MRQPDIRCVAAQDRVEPFPSESGLRPSPTRKSFRLERQRRATAPSGDSPFVSGDPDITVLRRLTAYQQREPEDTVCGTSTPCIGAMMTAAQSCSRPRATTAGRTVAAVATAIENRRDSPSKANGFLLPANNQQHATRVYFCCILIKSSTSINRTGVGFVHIRAIRQAFRQRHRHHGFPWFCVFRVCVCVTGFETSRARWPSGKRTWC